ncbi:MAG: DUF1214 domain-containing protein, partial [Lysobacterales bacterium]
LYSHNFKNIGSHLLNTDTRRYKTGHEFMLAGPDWQGEAPDGVELVRAPVNVFHFLLRIAVKDDPWDIARGRKLQEGTATMPLSARLAGGEQTTRHSNQLPGTAYRPVLAFGQGYDGTYQRDPEFFAVLEDALEINTPYTDLDKSMVEGTLAAMGVGSEQGFDLGSFDAATRALILDAQESGFNKVIGLKHQGWGPKINGWQYGPPNHGDYGRDFIRRAYGTYMGGMWPKPENSTYAMAYVDGKGTTLTGTNRYSLKFSAEQIPPATSFWSVTVYDAGSFDLHPNAEELYVVGSNHPSTKFAADGSMEVVFSQARPENLGNANWIPVPEGEFLLAIRFYAPTPEVLDLSYRIPPVNLEDHVGSELAQAADWHAIPGGHLDL